jgi:hypothetical protein
VLTKEGSSGFGFSLSMDAAVARDMAAWNAYAAGTGKPFSQKEVPVVKDEQPALAPDWEKVRRAMVEKSYKLIRIDPFAWGSVEAVQSVRAGAEALNIPLALLAPNAHPWEIAWCAALGGDRVIVRSDPVQASARSEIDWSLEPAFAAIRWLD